MKLKEGKPPQEILEKIVYKHLGIFDPDVVQGPAIGEDAGIVRLGDGFLVAHTDPITAAERFIGWLSVNVSANDVAVRGARPRWMLSTILLPPGTEDTVLENIVKQMDKAAKEINVSIIGGHTEVTPGIPRPIIVSTAIGYTKHRIVRTGDASPGDKVIIIGRTGGEGAGVIAWDFEEKLLEKGISKNIIDKAKEFIWDVSVVDKAMDILPHVSSMHDPTEGGILEGLLELAQASGNTVIVNLDDIVIDDIVEAVTKPLKVDPLRLLSSGALITAIPPYKVEEALSMLRSRNYSYCLCGEVVRGKPHLVIKKSGHKQASTTTIVDEIYKLWK